MSLLDKAVEAILVFPAIPTLDTDGNEMLIPSETGIPARATIQPEVQSGTSGRRAEQDNEGYETEENYRLRFARGETIELGLADQIEWRGERWSVMGHPIRYNGSRKTRHVDYKIRRS